MSNTSVEIELLMRDSTRKGMQSAENSIVDYQRMTEAVIKRLEGDIAQMQSRLSKGLDMESFVKESAKVEALTAEVEKLKRVIEELDHRKPSNVPLLPEDPLITKKKFDGLGMSFQQIARELPSLAMGPQMFFLAISNNLPIFTDQLAIARKEYEALTASGQKATPVWKQVMKSMFSWQTAMMVGISLLIVYGKEIGNWISGLSKAKSAVKALANAEGEMALARRQAIKDSSKEISLLDMLYKAATNMNKKDSERHAAVAKLQSLYPKMFSNYTKEEVMLGKAVGAYERLRIQIVATAKAKAYEGKIGELEIKRYDSDIKRLNQLNTLQKASAEYQKTKTKYDKLQKDFDSGKSVGQALSAARVPYMNAKEEYEKQKKVYDDIERETKDYAAKIEHISEQIDIEQLNPQPENGTYDYWQQQVANSQNALKQIKSDAKKTLDSASKQNKDLYSLGIDKAVVDSYKNAKKQLAEAQKNMKLYDDGQNSGNEEDKVALINAIADAQVEAKKKAEEAWLAIARDSYGKRHTLAQKELTDTLNEINKTERDNLKKLDDAKKKGVAVSPEKYDKIKDLAQEERNAAALKYADDYWNIEKEVLEKQQKLSDKERQSWIDHNKEYGTYQQKKLAIVQDYVNKLSSAETLGEKASLKKAMERQLKELDFTQFKDSIDFSQVFGNLDSLSTGSLERLREKLGAFIKKASKDLSPENTKELSDAFIQIDFKISERDPFKELKGSISEYKQAVEDLKQAEQDAAKVRAGETVVSATKYDAASGKIVKTLLTQEQAEKKVTGAEDKRAASLEKMNKSLHSGVGKAQEYLDVASAITGALESFGVEVPEEIGGAIEGFGKTLDALGSIDVTNPMSIVTGAIGAVGGLAEGVLSLFGSAKELSQETIDAYNNYMSVIDDLIAKQEELIQSTAGSSAVVLAKETQAMIQKQTDATREIGKDYFNSGASWKSSSHGVKQMDVIKKYRKELQGIGIDISKWGKRGTEIFDLSGEELSKIQKDFPKLWAELDESTRSYLQSIIDGDEKLNEILDQRNQSLTSITFDEARSGLKSLLMDADTTMAEVANNFEEYMRQAIVNTIIDSTLQDRIKIWYEKFAEAMDEKKVTTGKGFKKKTSVVEEAGILNEDEMKELQELYAGIYSDAKNLRDNAYKAAGINPEDVTKQSGQAGAFTTMTQDQGTKLEGLFISLQDHASSLDDTCKEVSGSLHKSSETLTKIEENTRRTADGIETIIRDGMKLK